MMSRSTQQFLASLHPRDTPCLPPIQPPSSLSVLQTGGWPQDNPATAAAAVRPAPTDFMQAAAGPVNNFMHGSLAPPTFADYQSARPVGLVGPSPPRPGQRRVVPLGQPVADSDQDTQESWQHADSSPHYQGRDQERDYYPHQSQFRDRSPSRERDLAFGPSPHRPRDPHRHRDRTVVGPEPTRDIHRALRALSYQSSRSDRSSSPGRSSSRRRRRRRRSSSGSASTLHRHRSRSGERGGGPRYSDKVALIRATLTDYVSKPLSPKKATVTLGVPTPDPGLQTSLPLTPFLKGLRDTHFQKLAGVHSSSKSAESGPWATGTYIKKPDWKPSNYRLDSAPRAALPAQLPTQLSTLQQGSSPKSITLTDNEFRELEANHRRVELILNNQHWFVGASLVKLQEEEASVPVLAKPPDAPPVIRPADLLLSAQRAGQDALRLNAYALHNLILRRRDAAIATLPKDLPDPMKRQLRCHPFDSSDLFNPDLCEHTSREYASRTQARELARELSRSSSGNRQRSSQPFPQASSGQRYDNRPPRDRQQQRPRNGGGGGGGGGGGPQQNPRGRGRGNQPSSSPSSYNKKGRGGGGGYRK